MADTTARDAETRCVTMRGSRVTCRRERSRAIRGRARATVGDGPAGWNGPPERGGGRAVTKERPPPPRPRSSLCDTSRRRCSGRLSGRRRPAGGRTRAADGARVWFGRRIAWDFRSATDFVAEGEAATAAAVAFLPPNRGRVGSSGSGN